MLRESFFPLNRMVLLVILLLTSLGCIHPNIPSIRYGEAGAPCAVPENEMELQPAVVRHEPKQREHFQPLEPEEEKSKLEVPWPRFHPLPTRPVLGPY